MLTMLVSRPTARFDGYVGQGQRAGQEGLESKLGRVREQVGKGLESRLRQAEGQIVATGVGWRLESGRFLPAV